MQNLNSDLKKFLKKQHILSLACFSDNEIWCANCFYVFDDERIAFVFASHKDTKHIKMILSNNLVSGTISNDTMILLAIKGVQFVGRVFEINTDEIDKYKNLYIKRFPFVVLKDVPLWLIVIDKIKYTCNELFGIGNKYLWSRE